ncbi:MAG: hypothetical protein OXC19_01050, partial [Bryobacterales bacterium]|nr:hypothetical protein [Bryobacterales bacterium]
MRSLPARGAWIETDAPRRACLAAAGLPWFATRRVEEFLHGRWPPRHVWLGTSVEDKGTLNKRIAALLE